jgi:hypothetical protein
MREINTKFGVIYIEDLEYDHHCPNMREEEDRIKVFDSLKRYMDYWSMDLLFDYVKMENKTLEEVYEDIIHRYENADNLDAICPDIRFSTTDLEKFVLFAEVDGYLEVRESHIIDAIFSPDGQETLLSYIKDHEYVNKIGDTYLLIEQY